MANRFCPMRIKDMTRHDRENHRGDFECLGKECMWYMSTVDRRGVRTWACAIAYGGQSFGNSMEVPKAEID